MLTCAGVKRKAGKGRWMMRWEAMVLERDGPERWFGCARWHPWFGINLSPGSKVVFQSEGLWCYQAPNSEKDIYSSFPAVSAIAAVNEGVEVTLFSAGLSSLS